jgi:hypothetical protein
MQILVAFIDVCFSVKQLKVKAEVTSEGIVTYKD